MYRSAKFKVIKQDIEYEFEPADEGGYIVTVPLYPSCASQGETFEEAMVNVEDALIGCLKVAEELKLPVPPALNKLLLS
jgi:predicted RNase H-like HicB family nuclease